MQPCRSSSDGSNRICSGLPDTDASRERPATLFYGDFAQNGTKLLAEAVYDGDRLYPLRARVDIGARLTFVLRKFPKNDDFARADMAEVFGEKALATADIYCAENFASGVFLSQPDGTYRFQPFPRLAQIGPMQGIVATDFDGDGIADICAVQNTDIAIPRFDGGIGVFLKGKSGGTFETIEPTRSGIVVPGNGRALAVIDPIGDARPHLFLTRQGGPSEFLANESAATHWVRLQLQGSRGNPDAVGAQVKLVFSNGAVTCHEIGLGGGWLSQSAPYILVAVPSNGRLAEAIVKWPDGHLSHHANAPQQGLWTIRRSLAPYVGKRSE